jgi:cytochrome P450 PksS
MTQISDIDLLDRDFAACPHAAYATMRSQAPVCRVTLPDGRDGWLVTQYEGVRRVLQDHARFSNRSLLGQAVEMPEITPQGRAVIGLSSDVMLGFDPPEHSRLREPVGKAFTPRLVESLRPYIAALAEELLDAVEARALRDGDRTIDLISDYAFLLPMSVIMQLLGIPAGDREDMSRWCGAMATLDGSVANAERIGPQIDEFIQYIKALVEHKRREPAEDLVSALVADLGQDEALTEEELVPMVFLLIFAGHETTTHLIGNGILALLSDPSQLAKLRADPALVDRAVEEFLRYDNSVTIPQPRLAVTDVELGGMTIKAGDPVLPVITSANRDEQRFEAPDTLDISRTNNRHLAFGRGIHTCPGAPLARMEAKIAIETLLRRMPDLSLAVAPEQLDWRPGGLHLRGLSALPLHF